MRVLFLHGGLLTFTRLDLDLLRTAFEVEEVHVSRQSSQALLRTMFAALAAVFRNDVVFSWFGAYHALLPFVLARLLGKPTIVVASGYDVANEPEIGYGNMRPGPHRWVGRAVFALADRILAVSHFTAAELAANVGVRGEGVVVVPHGIPLSPLVEAELDAAKEPFVLTVARITRSNLQIKGLLTVVEAARLLPATLFVVVGPFQDDSIGTLRAAAPPNVLFLGPRFGDDLVEIMRRAKVYAQLSWYESFGMALAEAMVCEAVPVTTRRAAIAEVVGPCGEVAPYGDAQATADAVARALAAPREEGRRAREYILANFQLETRRLRLIEEVQGAAARKPRRPAPHRQHKPHPTEG